MSATVTAGPVRVRDGAPLAPGPRGVPGLAAFARLVRDPWFVPPQLARRHGDVLRLPIPFADVVLISHPDHIAHVNLAARDRYERAPMVTDSMRVQGSPHHASWFDPDDAEWARGRKLLQPHFTQKALADLGHLFTEAVVEQVAGWGDRARPGAALDVVEPLKELALAVLYNAMFSCRIGEDEMGELLERLDRRMVATTVRTAMFSLPRAVPRPLRRRGAEADAWIDRHLAALIDERRRRPSGTTDLLNVLLGARYDTGEPLEDEKLRTEMLFLVIGGHETTAAALAWTFAFLGARPDVRERVTAEVDALGGRPVGPDDLAALPFVRACFDEAQRLQGGLVFNPKRAVVDDEIGGYRIPAGTTVIHSNIGLQRDPRFWGSDADEFRPDRWLEGGVDNATFQAFGRGPRMCMGKRFAYIEAVLTIATAIQRYHLRAPAGWQPRHQYRMSMTVKGGVPLHLELR